MEITAPFEVESNQGFSVQLVFHSSTEAPDGAVVFSRFRVTWNDDERANKAAYSNGVRYSLSSQPDSSLNLTGGEVQLFTPASSSVVNGQSLAISGDFFAPEEAVSLWYTDQDSNSVSLGMVKADSEGKISFSFSPSDLIPGETYVVAGYGNLSGTYGSTVLTIQ
jgi:hypothetical protein